MNSGDPGEGDEAEDAAGAVPIGLSRRWTLARLVAGAGVRATGVAVRGLFVGKEARARGRREALGSEARSLARELGALKGSMMKVGQLLSSHGEGVLPAEAVDALKALQAQAPPLPWSAIAARLRHELGAERLAELDVDEVPLGAASLGQVHGAVVRATGERLAIKVQYPGVDAAVQTDLSALRPLLRLMGLAPTGPSAVELFGELRSMLAREVDYDAERHATERFAVGLGGELGVGPGAIERPGVGSGTIEPPKARPRIAIPQTFPRYCTRRVLATERMDGHRADSEEVAAWSQDRRDALGALAFAALLHEVFVLREVQTDPHLGNYLLRDGGAGPDALVMLDFGAVRPLDDAILPTYVAFIAGAFRRDRPLMERAGRTMGFLRDGDGDEVRDRYATLCLTVMEPFADPAAAGRSPFLDGDGVYDWGASDLPARLAALGSEGVLRFALRTPPAWSFFLDRRLGGTYALLRVLGARFAGRPMLEAALASPLATAALEVHHRAP